MRPQAGLAFAVSADAVSGFKQQAALFVYAAVGAAEGVVGAVQADGAVGVGIERVPAGGQGRAVSGVAGEGLAPAVDERSGQRVARDSAAFAEAGYGLAGVGRRQEVEADTGDGVGAAAVQGGFEEDAAQFASVQVEVVRPFELYRVVRRTQCFGSGDAQRDAERGGVVRVGVVPAHAEDDLSGEGRLPGATAAAASGALVFSKDGVAVCTRALPGEGAVGGIGDGQHLYCGGRAGTGEPGGVKQVKRRAYLPASGGFLKGDDAARL